MDSWQTKQKIIVQIISLFTSIGLWLYVTNTENPIRTVEVNKVPVQLLNANDLSDQGMALVPSQNIYVDLKVEGYSQDVYKLNKDDFSIKIDLAEYALKIGNNLIPITIVDTPSNVTVKNTSNLVATVKIEEIIEKDFRVESRIDVAAKVNYYVAEPEIETETVTVTGPNSLVSQVNELVLLGQEDNVSEDIVKNYEVIPIDNNGKKVEGVKLSTEKVRVTIKVNAGKSVPIKVRTSGSTNKNINITSIELSQNYVELTGPQSILDNINEIYTDTIDLSKIVKNSNNEVALIFPSDVEKVSISHITVSIKVEEVKEEENEITAEFEVEYTTTGLEKEFNMTVLSNKVKVVLSGIKSKLDSVSIENIVANIDLSSITEAGEYVETPNVSISGDIKDVEIVSVESIKINISKEEPKIEDEETTTDEENNLAP
ncbi:MAG: CdaR family protein [Clostridium sp.]|nr:CdaR family protein [Clostridium sp.]